MLSKFFYNVEINFFINITVYENDEIAPTFFSHFKPLYTHPLLHTFLTKLRWCNMGIYESYKRKYQVRKQTLRQMFLIVY